MYKLALYGFGSFPVVDPYLTEVARAERSPNSSLMILTGPNWRQVVGDVLPSEEILDAFTKLPRKPIGGDPSLLSSLDDNLEPGRGFGSAQRGVPQNIFGAWLHARVMLIHQLYKDFLIHRLNASFAGEY